MNLINHMAPLFDAPAFLENGEHGEVSLEELKGQWVLLFFYPLDFTFVCPTEIKELQKEAQTFKDLNCKILSVSVDSTYSHEAWCKNEIGNLDFPMLSDITKRMSRDYGVLDENSGVSLRGTFIIDPEGRVQYQLLHNFDVGRNINELIRSLKALQSGELCFANWEG